MLYYIPADGSCEDDLYFTLGSNLPAGLKLDSINNRIQGKMTEVYEDFPYYTDINVQSTETGKTSTIQFYYRNINTGSNAYLVKNFETLYINPEEVGIDGINIAITNFNSFYIY